MKFKKAISALLCAAMIVMLLPVMPKSGEAATVIKVDPVKIGDTFVKVYFNGAKKGDKFELRLNGKTVNSGELNSEANYYGSMEFYFLQNYKAKAGDEIEFFIEKENDAFGEPTKVTVDGERKPVLPTNMVPSAVSVQASDNASVKLTFDSAYVPHPDDKIHVIAYDSNNAKMSEYDVELPERYTDPVSIMLQNSAKTAYYTLAFVSGSGQATDLKTYKITVTEGTGGGDDNITDDEQDLINNAVGMSFAYNSPTVSSGESVSPVIKLIDKQGKETIYNGPALFSYSGEAIVEGSFDNKGRFTVKSGPTYEGSKIQVTCMVGTFSKTVELTVAAGDKSLLLTPGTAGIGAARKVGFQLANGKGDRLRLLWQPTQAQVIVKTPDGSKAKTTGSVIDMSTITTTGDGKLLLSSDIPVDANVYIIFRDNEGRVYETATSKFSFTKEGANAVSVTLYINSNKYTLNGVDKTTYTKPVIKDNRTFVPFRLIAEVLGNCDVDFDDKTRTVVATDGTITVKMPIGSKEYTVNGVKKTMDVAPYINSDNRTMVPFRVLGEIFGCDVNHQAGANGATVSVTLERK